MHPVLPELLCPAGDEAALRAAVDNGANAVYLGYKTFGARASATNFDDEALESAVRYAHLYHTRVHVTVNTLVKPAELSKVEQVLAAIARAGADAVIVQDQGVAKLVRESFPSLALHASTQMAICNAAGAEMAKALGFSRVVLARECTLTDIRRVVKTGVETEVFAHGALCTAVSGRCLMSSLSGGRSGNRGRCAQPCRQPFSMEGNSGPLLSLRDLCLIDDLPALCESGVASLKLEGRLKSAEYVAVIASVYRKALDEIARGSFVPNDPVRRERLLQIYNRGGFTRGHAMGCEDAALVTPERVSHEGLPLGEIVTVKRDLATLRVDRPLNDGDTLQLRSRKESDLRYSGHDTVVGGLATLRLRPDITVSAGTPVFRLSDAKQLEAARAHTPRPIEVSLTARFATGCPMQLSMSDGEVSVTVQGPVVEAAKTRASTAEDAVKQLGKLGDTPFTAANADGSLRIQALVDDGGFLPVSALNALRRLAAEQLTEARIAAFAQPVRAAANACPAACAADVPHPLLDANTVAVVFSDLENAPALCEAGATLLIYAPRTFTPETLERGLPLLPAGTWLRLPPQLTQATLEAVLAVVKKHAAHLGGLVAESVGQLNLALPLPVLAGEGVPVTNREAMACMARTGVCGFVLWPEWNAAEQKGLLPFTLPPLAKVYGRETLMLLNHCPARVRRGLSRGRAQCALCANERMVCAQEAAALTDRKGYRFPLTRTRFPEGCEIEVLGALPTDLRACAADVRALGAGKLLHFTTETAQEQIAVTRAFAQGCETLPTFQTTAGHWKRGVE